MGGGLLFECPECGRTFGRAPALGAHRRRSHGVLGTSRRRKTRGLDATGQTAAKGEFDRDALLAALFPAGLPARATLLRDVQAWLNEAERLVQVSSSER